MFAAIIDQGVSSGHLVLLVVALFAACGFEFVNGFHDTANAVATVIYTRTMRPRVAVVYSGILNFLGVFLGGIAVALAIVRLLPVELLVQGGTSRGIAMVFALLASAMIWNIGTWYLGLPASSSHTLIGSILGVGLASSWVNGTFGDGVNWVKVAEVGASLLVSPLFGAGAAALLLFAMRKTIADQRVFESPTGARDEPPRWIRGLLVLTCGGVSFAHGSNDGQKGVGLIMLILVGTLPATFSLDASTSPQQLHDARLAAQRAHVVLAEQNTCAPGSALAACVALDRLVKIEAFLATNATLEELDADERWAIREAKIRLDEAAAHLPNPDVLAGERRTLGALTDYAPWWVLTMVAVSLGAGTMIGWKRIVVTVGEKIGKSHLTYAQGAAAELVAASTIGLSSWLGLPVSTTHVLSSGIAGTMAMTGGGVQRRTVEKIALAWVLTLPASMVLSAVFFLVLSAAFA